MTKAAQASSPAKAKVMVLTGVALEAESKPVVACYTSRPAS